MISEIQMSYLAGFFDGEGCISIKRHVKGKATQYVPSVSMTNTNKEIIELFTTSFGVGKPYYVRPNKYTTNTKASWWWGIFGSKSITIVESLFPYLLVKRQEALILLKFKDLLGSTGVPISESNRVQRAELFRLITALK